MQGHYAYVGVGLRLVVLDVSDPASPLEVGSTTPFPYFVEDIAISGTLACVAASMEGLKTVDVSDPTNPRLAGVYAAARIVSGTACPGCTAEVFSRAEVDGYAYLGSTMADSFGRRTWSGRIAGVSIATDAQGNTSEYAALLIALERRLWLPVILGQYGSSICCLPLTRHVQPRLKHAAHIFGAGVAAPDTLGDQAAALPEGAPDPADSAPHVRWPASGEHTLAVDLTPQSNSACRLRRQSLDIHAEKLGIDGVDAHLYQVRIDG